MNNIINKKEAILAAMKAIDLDRFDTRVLSVSHVGVYYEIKLRTDWMMYDCFVTCVTGELVGLDYRPSLYIEEFNVVECELIPTIQEFLVA